MISQEVGDSLFLVIKPKGDEYYVDHRVVWGRKDTETDFGERNWLVLVPPGEEWEPRPIDAIIFRHGFSFPEENSIDGTFVASFEEEYLAEEVCDYLNGY